MASPGDINPRVCDGYPLDRLSDFRLREFTGPGCGVDLCRRGWDYPADETVLGRGGGDIGRGGRHGHVNTGRHVDCMGRTEKEGLDWGGINCILPIDPNKFDLGVHLKI